MFIKSGHLTSIVSGVLSEAKTSWFLQPFAWRHKLAGVADGFITNQSLWDRLVFDGARARVIGDSAATLRAVVVSGGMTSFLSFAVRQLMENFRKLGCSSSDFSTDSPICAICEYFYASAGCSPCTCIACL